jgi:1-deoxyxylulose-5-phosphate synthase
VTAPIVGVTKIEHLDDSVRSLDVRLSDEDMAYLEELYEPKAVLEHD